MKRRNFVKLASVAGLFPANIFTSPYIPKIDVPALTNKELEFSYELTRRARNYFSKLHNDNIKVSVSESEKIWRTLKFKFHVVDEIYKFVENHSTSVSNAIYDTIIYYIHEELDVRLNNEYGYMNYNKVILHNFFITPCIPPNEDFNPRRGIMCRLKMQ